MNYSSLTVTSD